METFLNRKCQIYYEDPNAGWKLAAHSAKCIEQNGDYIKLAIYDKGKDTYDEENATWYDSLDPNFKFLWK